MKRHHKQEIEELFPRMMRVDEAQARQKWSRTYQEEGSIEPLLSWAREAVSRCKERQARLPAKVYHSLPIVEKREEIIRAICHHPVLILSGETGSGKSTQLPKFCLEAGRGIRGKVGCTQPRRIAALTIASRIAEELGEEVGGAVGCKIRFHEQGGAQNYIKVMTDGMLLAEMQGCPLLHEYDAIIVDEAHERSLNIDFLLGSLKRLLERGEDLKVIVTSATIDTERFSRFFDGAPVIDVSGRAYPVEVRYCDGEGGDDLPLGERVLSVTEEIVRDKRAPRGDLLIFMPTEQDILEACELLKGRFRESEVLPLYGRLPASQQKVVFRQGGRRKIIVATNVAETSVTIPGIQYVIDSGLARISHYAPSTQTFSLPIRRISRSSADQRKGRCGRTSGGICYRLYSAQEYQKSPRYTPPEIVRTNLGEVILQMLARKLGRIDDFPFIDSPKPEAIRDGYRTLLELGALSKERQSYCLTPIGRKMAFLPTDPRIARILFQSVEEGVLSDVLVIAAVLTSQDPRERPAEKTALADEKQKPFRDSRSDFLSFLRLWNHYERLWREASSHGALRQFCRETFLSFRRMREWRDIHGQLTRLMKEEGHKATPYGGSEEGRMRAIHRSIVAGYLSQVAIRKEKNIYRTTKGREMMLFPGSALFGQGREWVVSSEMVRTTRLYGRRNAMIEPEWLEELGAHVCSPTYKEPRWSSKRGEVIATEEVRLYGLLVATGRAVPYGPINPDEANDIFIHSFLVSPPSEDREAPYAFLRENLALRATLEGAQNKLRRCDFLLGEEGLYRFYKERIPHITDRKQLEHLLRKEGGEDSLRMKRDDLLVRLPDEEMLALFPDVFVVGQEICPIEYRFTPEESDDGVTLHIAQDLVPRVPVESLDWAVPGLLREKIVALLKGLPKEYRKRMVPIGETAEEILEKIPMESGHLTRAMGDYLAKTRGIVIPPAVWREEAVPEHLRLNLKIEDPKGRVIKEGRDRTLLLRHQPLSLDTKAVMKARREWEQDNLITWSCRTLPEDVLLEGQRGKLYPALVPERDIVSLRLLEPEEEAKVIHGRGVARLVRHAMTREIRTFRSTLSPAPLGKGMPFVCTPEKNEYWERLIEHLLAHHALVRTEEDFQKVMVWMRRELYPAFQRLEEQLKRICESYRESRTTLEALTREVGRYRRDFLEARERDLADLLPHDFLMRYSFDRLPDLPRYVKALTIRARKGCLKPSWEKEKEEELRPLWTLYRKEASHLDQKGACSSQKALFEELFWDLEEHKLSLFAGELQPKRKVSAKRLMAKLEEVRWSLR